MITTILHSRCSKNFWVVVNITTKGSYKLKVVVPRDKIGKNPVLSLNNLVVGIKWH